MVMLGQFGAVFNQAALAWAGAAAVSLPVAIHLLTRFRRQTQPWGAMRFLIESFRRHRHRLRLEQWVLLAVRCLIVSMLGLAMSGPVLSGYGSLIDGVGGGRSRRIHLLIDDSIGSRAFGHDGRRSIDRTKQAALSIVDALDQGDRVAVWRTGRSAASGRVAMDTDIAGARGLIESIEGGFASSDLVGVLGDLNASLRDGRYSGAENHVVLLSAFTRGAVNVDEPLPSGLVQIGRRSKLLASYPVEVGENIQVAQIIPTRRVVLTGAKSVHPRLRVAARLHRFGQRLGDGSSDVEVSAVDAADGRVLFVGRQKHRWSPGQEDGFLEMQVPLGKLTDLGDGRAGTGSLKPRTGIALSARIANAAQSDPDDVNDADNQRWDVIEARDGITVGLVSDTASSVGAGMRSDQWVRLALAPYDGIGRDDAVRVVALEPKVVDERVLGELDAAIVLQPQDVTDDGWDALGRFTAEGGITWVVVPSIERAPLWARGMREAFGIDWRLGLEPAGPSGDSEAPVKIGPLRDAPALLGELSSDWEALLRPVNVYRHFDLELEGGTQEVLLEMQGGWPLLTVAAIGDGSFVLLTTALDLDWTNLPAKPLFVPLVHELLRALIGRGPAAAHNGTLICGQPPSVDPSKGQPRRFVLTDLSGPSTLDPGSPAALRTGTTVEAPSPFRYPGFYRAISQASPNVVAVNPAAEGADTRPIDPARLMEWLGTAGPWEWIDPRDPAAGLIREPRRSDLSWPLLWFTGFLVVLETCLARWFTHGVVPPKSSGTGWRRTGGATPVAVGRSGAAGASWRP